MRWRRFAEGAVLFVPTSYEIAALFRDQTVAACNPTICSLTNVTLDVYHLVDTGSLLIAVSLRTRRKKVAFRPATSF